MSNQYYQLYVLNGHREKLASGSWQDIVDVPKPRLEGDMTLELVEWSLGKGRHHKYEGSQTDLKIRGTWDTITAKMIGAGNSDSLPHIILSVGLLWWGVLCLTLSQLGGVI